MREIEFRAWQKHLKEMFEVGAIQLREPSFVVKKGSSATWTLDEVELMQFTGLKDEQGKKIYEGDIVEWADVSVRGVVTWMDSGLFYGVIHANAVHGMHNGWTVIGNIYETPELVKHDPQP